MKIQRQTNDNAMYISRSVARSQCWPTVSIGIGLLSAPDVDSIDNNQPLKKLLWNPDLAGSIPHPPGLVLNQYTTWLASQGEDGLGLGSHRCRFFSGLIVIGTVNIWCVERSGALNNLVPSYTVSIYSLG